MVTATGKANYNRLTRDIALGNAPAWLPDHGRANIYNVSSSSTLLLSSASETAPYSGRSLTKLKVVIHHGVKFLDFRVYPSFLPSRKTAASQAILKMLEPQFYNF